MNGMMSITNVNSTLGLCIGLSKISATCKKQTYNIFIAKTKEIKQ